jgi:hypothetical protein
MLLHGSPPESVVAKWAPQLEWIVQDGARLRARLPAYLVQRRALLNTHCPLLLPPLQDLVHGYDVPTTTDELWATELGADLQRGILCDSGFGDKKSRVPSSEALTVFSGLFVPIQ